MFRVVPDQLRISEGWVRCGQCDEVFDANAHLRSLEEPTPVNTADARVGAATVEEPPPPDPIAEQTPVNEVDASYDWGPLLEPSIEPGDAAPSIPQAMEPGALQRAQEPSWREAAQPAATGDPQADDFLDQSPQDLPASQGSKESPDASAVADDWDHQPLASREMDDVAAADGGDDVAPSFMPRSPPRTRVRRYLGRKVMLLLFTLLALLLTSQWLFMERDRLAANIPALRPLLGAGCALLGCTLSAPRQIESIAIDSSAFTHVKSGVYNLSLSLRNGAPIDLATPALELTLTDMQDQALLRRVLLPGEYSAKTSIGAGAELVANVPIAVQSGVASEKISGYKLLAFYP
jgi:predicted Zn finger-like uncharacterized protein